MKKNTLLIIPLIIVLSFASCTKGFEQKNQDPNAITKLDAGLLFGSAERSMNASNWDGEQTIVQQYLNGYDAGATSGFNFNEDVDNYNSPRWNALYPNVIKPLVQIINLTKTDAGAKNLYNMARIWKAYAFMTLVDTYGDLPYSEAGLGYLEGKNYPKYDKMATIYTDIYNELKTATAALSASNEYVGSDLFYGGQINSSPALITAQVDKWKKLGYSLLLRLGMRYSKIDQTKAASIVQEAFAGGVMQTNADNAVINIYSAAVPNGFSNLQRTVSPYFYYLAKPFVDQLKGTNDPRLKYTGASYSNPADFNTTRDTTTAGQFGFPVGYNQVTIRTAPGDRGTKGGGQNYTQLNYQVVANILAPAFFVTNAQTQLLLAEAKFRGWITSATTTQQYYEAGVRASMDEWGLYPGVQSPAVAENEKVSYLRQSAVLYNDANALKLINTQYWIECITNGAEGWANFRRSGFPVLTPNAINTNLTASGGFVRRMAYPNAEESQNNANYVAAKASMGGDNLTQRIFWDMP